MLYSLPISKYIKLYNAHAGKWNISAPMNTVNAPELDDHINCSYIADKGYFTLLLVRIVNIIAVFLASTPPLRFFSQRKFSWERCTWQLHGTKLYNSILLYAVNTG